MHPPEISDESWIWTVATGVGMFFGGIGVVVMKALKGFKEGDKADEPQGFILERAELGNMGGLAKAIEILAAKIEMQGQTDAVHRALLEANHELMKEMILICRRSESVIERIGQDLTLERGRAEGRREGAAR